MQKNVLWILAVVIIAGGWLLYSSKASAPTVSENAETPLQEVAGTANGGMPVPGTRP